MAEQRPRSEQAAAPGMPFGGRGGPGMRPVGPVVRAKDTRGTVRRIWGYLRRQRAALLLTAVMVIGASLLTLLGPYLLGEAIDAYILRGDLPGLGRLLALMAGAFALTSLLTWAQSWVMAGAAQRTVRDIRKDLFARMQRLPLRYFDQRPHGELMSRLTNDVESINTVLTDSVAQIVSGVLTAVGVVVIMVALNPSLAAVSLISVSVLTVVVNRWVASSTREAFRRQQATLGTLNGMIEETVGGQRVVKAYNREREAVAEFGVANGAYRRAATRAQIFAGFVGPLMNFINNLGIAVVAGVGGFLVLGGSATVGTIATFMNYTRQFGRPLNEIANLYNQIQAAVAGAERVFEVIDEQPEVDTLGDPPGSPLHVRIEGDVVFDGVSFSYDRGVPVLRDVSLHAEPGQLVALVGPTGAGKTTIINLLTRFYEVDGGSIRIDGRDIREIEKEALRQQLGIVLQDTVLFAGSVKDNIRYGRLDASDEEVVAAARLANADQFIHRLPQGYDTALSERGGNLSQGQRQLLAIARAILADPRILILDEATSSVDTRTEKQIQEAMLRLMSGRTSFVIAHRLSTIREADQILVIDRGEVVERGTHGELLRSGGFYARLYSGQFATDGRAGGELDGVTDDPAGGHGDPPLQPVLSRA